MSMRASARHELAGLAICASLAVALSSTPAAVAGTRLQIGSLVNIEAAPLPAKVEAAGVTIETPPLPGIEAPSTPPVQPPVPVEVPTTPMTSTPLPAPSPAPTPPSGGGSTASGAGSQSAAGAPAAAGAPRQAGPGTRTATAPSRGRSTRPSADAQHRRGAKSRANAASGVVPASLVASAAPTVGSSPALGRTPATSRAKGASSNPLEAIGRQIPFPVPVPDWSKPIILALLLIAVWFAVRSRLATVRARRLEGQRASMLSDLGDMQAALVPAIPRRLGALSVSVAYQPADGPAAGGDFYDIFALDGGKVAIVIGDVVGHGRPALTQAALTRYTLRAYLQAGLEPRAALALGGSVLASPGEKRFATVVIAIHDAGTGRLTYACAGHPAPISIGFDAPEPIAVCCSAPICCDLPTGRRQTTVSLPAGGRLCFFSDGLPEARVGDDLLGRERLIEITRELSSSAGAAELLERIRTAADATPDDMVACLISPLAPPGDAAQASPAADGAAAEAGDTGSAPGAGQVEELEVDEQMLDGPRVRSFLDACGIPAARCASLLARAGEIAAQEGSALLRIERPRAGEPTAIVSAGSSAGAPVTAEVTRAAVPALVLASTR
jgi:hypothetical protein